MTLNPWKDRKSTYTLFSFQPDSIKIEAPTDTP